MSKIEAIIIAGGFGTRLAKVVGEVPKPMAPVAGRPFLEILLERIARAGVSRAVLALGYKADVVISHFERHPAPIPLTHSIETEPLGTGGCVKLALLKTSQDNILVLNGDTLFDVDVREMQRQHEESRADVTLALRHVSDCSRYGSVAVDQSNRVIGFGEKISSGPGYVNGGVFMIRRDALDGMPQRFSIESEFLSQKIHDINVRGFMSDGYFIDIGTPEDYAKAQHELK